MAKKTSRKSRSAGASGSSPRKPAGMMKKTARKAKKVVKKTARKTGITKTAVKKKVVKKLKEVGVAMARAAMDELMPADQQNGRAGNAGNAAGKAGEERSAGAGPR